MICSHVHLDTKVLSREEGTAVKHPGRIPHGVPYLGDLRCSAQHQEGFGCHGGRWFDSVSVKREMFHRDRGRARFVQAEQDDHWRCGL